MKMAHRMAGKEPWRPIHLVMGLISVGAIQCPEEGWRQLETRYGHITTPNAKHYLTEAQRQAGNGKTVEAHHLFRAMNQAPFSGLFQGWMDKVKSEQPKSQDDWGELAKGLTKINEEPTIYLICKGDNGS
jgi:hypothetical protein